MGKIFLIAASIAALASVTACDYRETQEEKDSETVEMQQSQYAKAQPVPLYDFSLERELVIDLYDIRNQRLATHSVWRSDFGVVEGDCPSMGYGLPYDTSLTNPSKISFEKFRTMGSYTSGVVGQPEPNGVFASTNTAATWVMCIDEESGLLSPVYVEAKVTGYPYPVAVDYETNRVTRAGSATVTMDTRSE